MLKESIVESNVKNNLELGELLSLGIATSIDAFSVGLTFSLFKIVTFLVKPFPTTKPSIVIV